MRAARIWRPETMLLITQSIYDSGNAAAGHPALSKAGPDIRYHVCVMVSDGAGCALRLSCLTYCHIRIKLAATSTIDEPAFLATLIELSVCPRQFRVSNEPKMVSGTKRLLDA